MARLQSVVQLSCYHINMLDILKANNIFDLKKLPYVTKKLRNISLRIYKLHFAPAGQFLFSVKNITKSKNAKNFHSLLRPASLRLSITNIDPCLSPSKSRLNIYVYVYIEAGRKFSKRLFGFRIFVTEQ